MTEAVIVSTARSPFGRAFKGSLKEVRPDDLAATVFYLLGIDPATQVRALGDRPVNISDGKPVMDILA